MSKWHVIQSPTDSDMFAVKSHYEYGELHPEYIVADSLPLEDATLIAAAPDLLEAIEYAMKYIPRSEIPDWPGGWTVKREATEKCLSAIRRAKGPNHD